MMTTWFGLGLMSFAQLAPLCQLLSAMPCHVAVPNALTHWDSSEVSPVAMLVAVAVMKSPTPTSDGEMFTLKLASPAASVVTLAGPTRNSPSPKPEVSHVPLVKNSTRKDVFAVELNVPCMLMLPLPVRTAEVT